MKRLFHLALAAAVLPAGIVFAAEFNQVQSDRSQIRFVSKQMGVAVEGSFRKFATQVSFDPAKPGAGRAQIDIDLASIDAGSAEADDEVKSKSWFNTREFPTARFVSTGVRSLGGNRYEVRGQMTIKGRTREVAAPFSYRQDGAAAVLEGSFPLQRLQFGIGDGAWSDTATVADEVQVRFRFTVGAARK